MSLKCTQISEEEISCNGTTYVLPEEVLSVEDTMFWVYIAIYVGLVLFAGLVSGLTMGLLSLDQTTLLTLRDGGTPTERKHAQRILPVIKRHHLLLVTLLLANAGAVEAMPIFLDHVSNPIIAIVISVTAVLIFGEVIPQAICTRHGLAIGSYLSPVVYFLMAIFFVIAYPLSKLLDCILGVEHGTFFRRAQLKALIDIHGEDNEDGASESGHGPEALTKDEVLIIKGVLDMKYKTAQHAMVDMSQVYMLGLDDRLDRETMDQILQKGRSRIPVYGGDRSNVVALLLSKTLIQFDPDDAVLVSDVVSNGKYARQALFIDSDMPLFDLLNVFQTGKSHLALVRKATTTKATIQNSVHDQSHQDESEDVPLLLDVSGPAHTDEQGEGEVIGLITLEDVIEEMLQEEIDDETDVTEAKNLPWSLSRAYTRKLSQEAKRDGGRKASTK